MELAAIACVVLLALGPWVSGEVNDTIRDTIVLHTPLQNYEQPSLRDYEECQANRQSCMDICGGLDKCESECPLCPELTDEPLLVQGVNDTSYVPLAQPALNTTNIIRLTNEINNIIKNNIQGRNEVNVKVHQNVSQVGGRFGLGYNEQGSCCYVVRRERDCEHKEHCREHSRHRVCGERCQARVMHAKRVVICEKDQPYVCQETVEYVPVHRRRSKPRKQARTRSPARSQSQSQAPHCNYMNAWPYVACGQNPNSIRLKRSSCQNCLQMSYGYILQNGLPAGCTGCFANYGAPLIPSPLLYAPYPYPNFFYNYQPPPMYEDQGQEQEAEQEEDQEDDTAQDKELDNDTDTDSGWVLESEKCVGADGQLEDCKSGANDNDVPKQKPSPPAHLEEDSKDYDYDPGYDVPAQRRRRRQSNGSIMNHKFHRSPARSQSQSLTPRCNYMNAWPYVACGQNPNSIRLKRSSCQNCLQMSYGYILQNGLPAGCTGCFANYGAPLIPSPLLYAPYPYPNFFYNYQPPPMYEDQGQEQEAEQEEEQEEDTAQDKELDNDTDTDSGWVLESEKCVGADGQLEDCKSGGNGNDVPKNKPLPPAHLEDDPGYDVPAQRRHWQKLNFRPIVPMAAMI